MLQLKTIFLTTDFSDNSQAAVPYAAELARKFGCKIQLAYVCEDSDVTIRMPGEGHIPFDWINAIRIERKLRLTLLAGEIARTEHVEVLPLYLEGHAASEILNAAKTHHADCIVIATHGRTGLSHFVYGSVAERVVQHSACPVLTVRPEQMKQRA